MNKITRGLIPIVAFGLLLGLLHIMVGQSQASTIGSPSVTEEAILVTTLDDELNIDGDCSLREAIQAANTNLSFDGCAAGDAILDVITFEVAGTITVDSQLEVLAGGPLIIDGGEVITTSGGGSTRVWWIETGSDLILMHMTIVNGKGGAGGGLYNNSGLLLIAHDHFNNNQGTDGGGIYNAGMLQIENSSFSNNNASLHGGAIYNTGNMYTMNTAFNGNDASISGGAIENREHVEITSSTFTGNTSVGGAGIFNSSNSTATIALGEFSGNDAYDAGAIGNSGTLTLTDSTISGNSTTFSGGGISNYAYMTISNSTISGNSASQKGGGIYNDLSYYAGDLTITNSTISGNNGGNYGGGIYVLYSDKPSTLGIIYSTITGNRAATGGGIYHNGSTTLSSSIIAKNPSGTDCQVNSGTLTDGGYNIDSDGTCGLNPANGSLPDTDPRLGPLQDNGGPTLTHALLWGSPAIDASSNEGCPATDQRGVTRPVDGNRDGLAVCDIGSFEFNQTEISFLPIILKHH